MSTRLKTGLWVQALLRRAGQDGSSAMLLRRGDEDAGTVLVVLMDRTGNLAVLREAGAQADTDGSGWTRVDIETTDALSTYLDRQTRYDPDLWIIEIEVRDIAVPAGSILEKRYAS